MRSRKHSDTRLSAHLFDFTLPRSQTTLETVSTLVHMARFVIADLTDAKSVLQELRRLCPAAPRCWSNLSCSPLKKSRACLTSFGASPGCWNPIGIIARRRCWPLNAKIITPVEDKVRELAEFRMAQAEARFTPLPGAGDRQSFAWRRYRSSSLTFPSLRGRCKVTQGYPLRWDTE